MRFSVSFFSSANYNFLFFSPEMGDKYCSIFEMVYWNRISLMILVNDIKFIHLLPIFLTFSCPFAMQGYVIHQFIRILLISLQALSATEWYSLNGYNVNYTILKMFKKIWSGLFTSTHSSCWHHLYGNENFLEKLAHCISSWIFYEPELSI